MARIKVNEIDAGTFELVFLDEDGRSFEASLTRLSESIVQKLALHGLKTRLVANETFDRAVRAWQRLLDEEWRSYRRGGPLKAQIEALKRLAAEQGRDWSDTLARRKWAALEPEKKVRLARNPRFKAILLAVRAERAEQEKEAEPDGQIEDLF